MDDSATQGRVFIFKRTAMNIGITSQNFRTITGHAGKARRFLIFVPDSSGNMIEAERLELPMEMTMHNFQGGPHPLDDLDVLITQSCGQGFSRNLATRGVRVIITGESDPLTAAQAVHAGQPLLPPKPHTHHHAKPSIPIKVP
jgi:predicted Fe-Mo cluster-binding NifX family protein